MSAAVAEKIRRAARGNAPAILNDIHREDVNMAIWQRQLSVSLKETVKTLLIAQPDLQLEMRVTPQTAFSRVNDALETIGSSNTAELSHDIAALVESFCRACDVQRVDLRLTTLDGVMCPKFHADYVPCRLLTTYQGMATEWLPHQVMDRAKLGLGSNGLSDEKSGLFRSATDIQQLHCGDVALLKGDLWQGNKDAGLVHRSPVLSEGDSRLLLRLDYG